MRGILNTSENLSSEKLIIQTSILFISISSVIGLALGGLYNDYRVAYVNLGKMLYYSLPFIVASLWAFLATVAEPHPATSTVLFRKLAWAFYITGFIFIIWLAAFASRTELLPEGFIFAMGPTEIVVFQLVSAGIIFAGFYIASKPRKVLTVIFALALIAGVSLMASGIFQTSNILKTDVVSLEQRYSNSTIDFSLVQAQQVAINLQSISNEARFRYYFMTEEEFKKANASGDFFTASSLAQDAYVNQKAFATTIQTTGNYFLFIQSDYFLGQNVTYTIKVYATVTLPSFVGFWAVVIGAAGLGSYVVATDDDEPEKTPKPQT